VFLKAYRSCLFALALAFCVPAPSFADKPEYPDAKPKPRKKEILRSSAGRTDSQDNPSIRKGKVAQRRKTKEKLSWFLSAGGSWFMYYYTSTGEGQFEGEHGQWSGYLSGGIRHRGVEYDLRMELSHVLHQLDSYDFHPEPIRYHLLGLGLDIGFQFYSYRYGPVRSRHGLHVGVFIPLATKCGYYDEADCDRLRRDLKLSVMPRGSVHLWDVLFRLYRNLWLEISTLNFGFPMLYSVSVGLRWESG
jgi:hypothetical protein